MTDLPPSASRSSSDVLRRVAELFPDDQTFVLALLEDYKDPIASRRARVQWVIVEASRGDLDRLAYLVDLAKIDYRDVLMYEEP